VSTAAVDRISKLWVVRFNVASTQHYSSVRL
jgi:hypothetical protein